jgi:glycosyltransferase involved in cell wall biosynthesis
MSVAATVNRPALILIVPCYNEAARLNPPAFLDFVSTHSSIFLLFVDDGSGDATAGILEGLRSAAPASIGVMRLASHQGKAEAVRLGILEGIRQQSDLVGFWDADLSTPLTAIDDFLALAERRPGMEVLLGSRVNLMGKAVRRRAWRHYLGRVFATAVSLSLDLPVYDTQCGAKVFRVNDAIAAVFEAPFRSRWIFDVELLARYLAQPAPPGSPPRRSRIYELAVPAWREVPGSRLRWFHYVRATFDLVRIRRSRTSAPGTWGQAQ